MPGIREMVRTLCDGMSKEFGEGRDYVEIRDRYADAYETLTGRTLTINTVAKACNRECNRERIEERSATLTRRAGEMVINEGMTIAAAAKELRISSTDAAYRVRKYKEEVLGIEKKKEEKPITMRDVRAFRNESKTGDRFRVILTKENYDAEMRKIKTTEEKEVVINARYTFVADTNIGTYTWTTLYQAKKEYENRHKEEVGNV